MTEEHGGVVPKVVRRNGPNGDDSHADHGAGLDADIRLHFNVVWREGSEGGRELGREHQISKRQGWIWYCLDGLVCLATGRCMSSDGLMGIFCILRQNSKIKK